MVNFLTLAACLPLAVLAVPSIPTAAYLPVEARRVAYDETSKRLIAFDNAGRHLGSYPVNALSTPSKRATGTCTVMNNDDISKMPGIGKLRAKADELWGTGKRNEVVNDKDFPERSANVCADPNGALVVYDTKPDCKESDNGGHDDDDVIEPGGKIILNNQASVSLKATTQVTKSSSFGIGATISAKVGVPEVLEIGGSVTTTSEFTNTQGETHEIASEVRQAQTFEQIVGPGAKDCRVELKTQTCSISGQGSLKMIAKGFVWFQFEDRVDGHYKWGMTMEDELPNVDDRASTIDFQTTGSLNSEAKFGSQGCNPDPVPASSTAAAPSSSPTPAPSSSPASSATSPPSSSTPATSSSPVSSAPSPSSSSAPPPQGSSCPGAAGAPACFQVSVGGDEPFEQCVTVAAGRTTTFQAEDGVSRTCKNTSGATECTPNWTVRTR